MTYKVLIAKLADRLHDRGRVFWTNSGPFPELPAYLREALRVYGALTAFYRGREFFPTTLLESFYDLNDVGTTLEPQITQHEVIADVQMRLMEPVSPTIWLGSEQYSLDDVCLAIQRRRDRFLVETGQTLISRYLDVPSPRGDRVVVPESVISIRRASYADAYTAQWSTLWRDDTWSATGYRPSIPLTPGRPRIYMLDTTIDQTMQLAPPPIEGGQIRLISVETGPPITPSDGTIGVADDWVWVVTWGALADLFGMAGLAQDDARASYCEGRWQQGIEVARTAARVLRADINRQPVMTMPIADADSYSPGWENMVGPPKRVMLAGLNLVAIPIAPDVRYGVGLDVILPAPMPVGQQDQVIIPDEMVDAILDYAQHIAACKQGMGAIQQSQGLLERFMLSCGVAVAKFAAESPNEDLESASAAKDEGQTPRLASR